MWTCTYSCWISTKDSNPTRRAVSATPKRCAHHPQCTVLYCTLSIGNFKSATFGERIWHVSGSLSRPFLTWFPCTSCHIKEQGFGNKLYISEVFTVVGYLHTAGFKNRRGTFCTKCTLLHLAWDQQQHADAPQTRLDITGLPESLLCYILYDFKVGTDVSTYTSRFLWLAT